MTNDKRKNQMKKFTLLTLSLVALAAFPLTAFSQGGAVTPTATPFASTGLIQPAKTYHYKIKLDQITALGAATSGNIKLFTTQAQAQSGNVRDTAPKTVIDTIIIETTTAVTGSTLSAATARVQTGNNYGSTKSVFTATGATVQYVINTSGYVEAAATDVNLALTTTGANLSAATAGEIDVYIQYRVLQKPST